MSLDQNLKASLEVAVRVTGENKFAKLKTDLATLMSSLGSVGTSIQNDFAKAAVAAKVVGDEASKSATKVGAGEAQKSREVEKAWRLLESSKKKEADLWKRVEADKTREEQRTTAQKKAMFTEQEQAAAKAAKAEQAATAARVKAEAKANAEQLAAYRAMLAEQEKLALASAARIARAQNTLQALGRAQYRANNDNARIDYAPVARDNRAANSLASSGAAYEREQTQLASRQARLLQEQSALNAANAAKAFNSSFAGKLTSGMSSVAQSASTAFSNSFRTGLTGGAGGLIAGFLGLFAARAVYKDNVQNMAVTAGLESAYGDDKEGAARRKQFLVDNATKYGLNYGQTATTQMNVVATAKSAGMSEQKLDSILNGFDAWFKLRGTDQLHQKVSMNAVAQGLGEDNVHSMQVNRELNRDLPGIKNEMVKYLKSLGGPVQSAGDFDKLLKGKLKDSNGQTIVLKSSEFWSGFGEFLEKTKGATAEKLAATSPLGAVNTLGTEITKLNIQFGKSGAAEGFVNAIHQVTSTLSSPEVKGMVDDLGKSAKQFGERLAPIVRNIGDWVKQNTGLIESVVGVTSKVGGASLILSAFLGIVAALASPFLKLGGAILFIVPKIGALMTGLGSAEAGLLTFGRAVVGLKMTEAAAGVSSFGTAVAGMLSKAWTMVNGVLRMLAVVKAVEVGSRYLDKKDAAEVEKKYAGRDRKTLSDAELGELRSAQQSASNAYKGDGSLGDSVLGVAQAVADGLPGADGKTGRGRISKSLDKFIGDVRGKSASLVDGSSANLAETNAEFERRTNLALQDETKAGHRKASPGDGSTGSPYGTDTEHAVKGRGIAAQSSEIEGARRAAAAIEAEETRRLAKNQREAAVAELKEQLEEGKVGYEEYYKKINDLALAEKTTEIAAIAEKRDADVASYTSQVKRDGASQTAAAIHIASIKRQASLQELQVEEKFKKVRDENDKAKLKQAKAFQDRISEIGKALDAETGRTDVSAAEAGVDAKYRGDTEQAKASGDPAAIAKVANLVLVEKLKVRILALDEKTNEQNALASAMDASVALRLEKGLLTKSAAEGELLAIKKATAAASLEVLDRQLAEERSVADTLQNKLKIMELETRRAQALEVIVSKTRQEKELEQSITDSISTSLQSVADGSKSVLGGLKDIAKATTKTIGKNVSDNLAGMATQYLKGKGGADGKGGFDVIGGLSSMLGFGSKSDDGKSVGTMNVKSLVVSGIDGLPDMTGGSASGASSGGGLLGTLFTKGLGWLSGLGGSSAAAGGVGASSVDYAGMFAGAGATFPAFAGGGPIKGKGTAKSDSITIRAANGEYMLTPPMIEAFGGVPALEGLRMQTRGYADGGLVQAAQSGSVSASKALSAARGGDIHVHMAINTPDASSFRATQSQIVAQGYTVAQRARTRNG